MLLVFALPQFLGGRIKGTIVLSSVPFALPQTQLIMASDAWEKAYHQ